MAGFQTAVTINQAPAVEGDFCDANPRSSVIAGPGGLVAGAAGLTIARFAWYDYTYLDPNGTPLRANNYGAGPPTGFIHRENQALLTTYLAESSMFVPAGFGITLMNSGGYWVKNNGLTEALVGQKAYANVADGKISFAATGAALGATSSAGSIAANTGSFTGSISGNVMTITAVGSGVVVPGGLLSGTGVVTGTRVVSQLSGTAGGIGTYSVSIPQTVASTTISETYGTLTIGGTIVGTFGVGQSVSGSGVTAGTTITALGTGTGGAGTYIVDTTQTAGSTAVTGATNVETKWVAASSGLPGELVKMTAQLNG